MTISTHRKLDDRTHICARPSMYIGSIDKTSINDYILEDDGIHYKEITFVPGLVKIINEVIDNSVDEAIKTKFKFSNQIKVTINANKVQVDDNGRGIPVKKNDQGHWIPELCWNNAKSGSNFDDDDNRTQIGMNGVGSYATACFSKKFVGNTDDGENSYSITIKDNAESFTESIGKTSKNRGTSVIFFPDLERFGLSEIDEVHQNIIKQRLINLSMSFPEITFKFNGKKINVGNFKKYIQLFNENSEVYETENYRFAILPNPDDDFRQFSYVNGLKIPNGGTHIDIIINQVVNGIREKLVKKFKSIKPGDIRNKLMVVAFLKDVPNLKFDSQTKERITNGTAEINEYYGNIPFETIVKKILRNSAIIDPITEIYRIKEEFKKRQELKGLEKPVKNFKSERYLPPIGEKKYLFIVEGDSALGGLEPVLGRQNCGYYNLGGKPLNAYSAPQSKFTANVKLSDLYKVIQNEGFQYYVYATDQDLDGYHIRGLLTGMIERYLPDLRNGKIGILQTPVIGITKSDKLVRWNYNLNDETVLKPGETSNYYKGLGTWESDDLKHIVKTDGIEQMIQIIDFDCPEMIQEWLGDDSEPRKKYILDNEFSIAKC